MKSASSSSSRETTNHSSQPKWVDKKKHILEEQEDDGFIGGERQHSKDDNTRKYVNFSIEEYMSDEQAVENTNSKHEKSHEPISSLSNPKTSETAYLKKSFSKAVDVSTSELDYPSQYSKNGSESYPGKNNHQVIKTVPEEMYLILQRQMVSMEEENKKLMNEMNHLRNLAFSSTEMAKKNVLMDSDVKFSDNSLQGSHENSIPSQNIISRIEDNDNDFYDLLDEDHHLIRDVCNSFKSVNLIKCIYSAKYREKLESGLEDAITCVRRIRKEEEEKYRKKGTQIKDQNVNNNGNCDNYGLEEYGRKSSMKLITLNDPSFMYPTPHHLDVIQTALPLYEMYERSDMKKKTQQQDGISLMLNVKSLQQKCELLDFMLSSYGTSSEFIIPVILFCERTLEFELFMNNILKPRRNCLRLYIRYLRDLFDWEQLFKVLNYFELHEDIFYIQLELALRTDTLASPFKLFDRLEACLHDLSQRKNMPANERQFHSKIIERQLNLLGRQIKIEGHDAKIAERNHEEIFRAYQRWNIIGTSLADTLYYCLLYHPHAEEKKLSSPQSLKNDFEITEKRYQYLLVKARSKCTDWNMILSLFDSIYSSKNGISALNVFSSIFRGQETQKYNPNVIPPHHFIELVGSEPIFPSGLIEQFLRHVYELEDRYLLAKQYKLYQICVDSLIQMKDRKEIIRFRKFLVDNHQPEKISHFRESIDMALHQSNIKWIN